MTTFGDTVYQWGGTPVGGDFLGLVGDGRVWWYDASSGSTGGPGTRPDRAVSTIAGAYALVSGGRGDVIVALPGWETATANLALAKGGMTLISSSFGVSSVHEANHSIYQGTADTPLFTLEEGVSIIGMQLYSGDTRDPSGTTQQGGVIIADGDSASWKGDYWQIKNCYISGAASPTSGIAVFGSEKFVVEDCYFYGWNQNMSSGISLRSGSVTQVKNFVIRRNYFNELDNGIRAFAGTFTGGLIKGNDFVNCTTNAIHTNNGASGEVLVAENNYDMATDTAAYDRNVSGSSWVFAGNNYAE